MAHWHATCPDSGICSAAGFHSTIRPLEASATTTASRTRSKSRPMLRSPGESALGSALSIIEPETAAASLLPHAVPR